MNEARAALILALFAGGIVGGVVLQRVTDAGTPESPYPALDRVAEPEISARVAAALANNDSHALSQLVAADTLSSLRDALVTPLQTSVIDVRGVKFVGATQKNGMTLAAYVLTGKDVQGTDAIVGFVFDIANGEIVGVN